MRDNSAHARNHDLSAAAQIFAKGTYFPSMLHTIKDHKDIYMVLGINFLHSVPFLRNVKSYFELHIKQQLNTGQVWIKIKFAEHNSV
jgi:hypothetical protein